MESKPKIKYRILLPLIAGILVIAILICIATNFFGLYGPTTRIIAAVKPLLDKGNFTVTIQNDRQYTDGDYSTSLTCKVSIDFGKKDLTLAATEDDGDIAYAVYRGYLLYHAKIQGKDYYYGLDIREYLDKAFDTHFDSYDLQKIVKDLDEDLYRRMDEAVDWDKLEKGLLQIFRNGNSSRWLKENAGFICHRADGATIYTFQPHLPTFGNAVISELETAFRDPDDYEAFQNRVQTALGDESVSLSVGIKGGVITSLSYSSENAKRTQQLTAQFSSIGTTSIDNDALDAVLAMATILN